MEELVSIVKSAAIGGAIAAVIVPTVTNLVAYSVTKNVALRQESWTSDEFLEKLRAYMEKSWLREEYQTTVYRFFERVLTNPGKYLASRQLTKMHISQGH